MILNSKTLIGLHVRTQAGTAVGKVTSLDVDADTGRLVTLYVKTPGIVPGLLNQELAISWGQIVEITEKEVIVKDGTVPVGGRALAIKTEPAASMQVAASEASNDAGATMA